VFAAMVTFRLHLQNWSRSDWCNVCLSSLRQPIKVSFPNTLPAATGVVPEANGAAGAKVSSAMI
jgi:hypothetical protein